MRCVVTTILLIALCSSALAQERELQTTATPKIDAQQSQQGSDNRTAPQNPTPQRPSVPAAHTAWYKHSRLWFAVGFGALGAAGGYLVSRGETASKVSGGVMIGVSGIVICTVFVRGCTR